jgi:hypothetical protein
MEDPIIEIRESDIFENFNTTINESSMFSISSNIDKINAFIFYIDKDSIINYKRYEIDIVDNKLTKKEILSLILENNKYYSNTYDLVGIYKYGFNLDQKTLEDFCKEPDSFDFMTSYKKIDDIVFEPSIEMFKCNNCLFLYFRKQVRTSNRKPKQPTPESERQDKTNATDSPETKKKSAHNKTTKKVRFYMENHNKTIKKHT